MTYQAKYIPPSRTVPDPKGRGRKLKTSTCVITRDKYYAWLKHKAQAAYKGEEHYLTWEDWQTLWPDNLWFKRGRKIDNLCLTRPAFDGPWSMQEVEVTTRRQHFIYKKAYNQNVRS